MKTPDARDRSGGVSPDNEAPDLPGLRSWRGVYLFVMALFVAMVAILAALPHLAG